jgi:hypothetical protein
MRRHLLFCVSTSAVLALLLVAAGPVHAQGKRQGRITGTVSDSQGSPVADVSISITTKANSSFHKKVQTAKDGSWAALLNDATVSYHYRFEKAGFVTVETDKKVPVLNPGEQVDGGRGSEAHSILDVQLQPAAPANRSE